MVGSVASFLLPPSRASEGQTPLQENRTPSPETKKSDPGNNPQTKTSKKAEGNPTPPGPSPETFRNLKDRLDIALNGLKPGSKESPIKENSMGQDQFNDVAIYARAMKMGLDLREHEVKGGSTRLAKVAETGLARARILAQNQAGGPKTDSTPWVPRAQLENRAYKSHIDDSLQPYAVRFPKEYDQTTGPWAVEVVLHGRNDGLTEALFLVQHDTAKATREPAVILEVFGRGNNAYRFAGETDVLEAIEDLFRRENSGETARLDVDRVLLRGFSMGGAGTWHLGLHHADRFYAIQPGAGFTKSIGYTKLIPENLPDWKKQILARYDAFEAARNLFMVPAVAYSGGDDPQMDAALTIEKALESPGMPKNRLTHIIAPGLGQKLPPEWKTKVDAALEPFRKKGRQANPETIDWTALSARHGKYAWLEISGLKATGKPGRVVASRQAPTLTLTTNGVTHIRLSSAAWKGCQTLLVDGEKIPLPESEKLDLERTNSTWGLALQTKTPRKSPALQGPIDDAFMDRFIVTLGKGTPQNPAAQKHAEALLEQFRAEWTRYMRGDFPFVEEKDITPEILKSAHIVVFGDPGSSKILGQVKQTLPFVWNPDRFQWGRTLSPNTANGTPKDTPNGPTIPKGDLLPSLVLPNPLNPSKYLVINSGHTFHEKEFQATNALLFSQLGDFGLWNREPGTNKWNLVDSGLFNENWAFEP